MDMLYFKTRKEWRAWLRKNHAKEPEVWLVHYKKHTKTLCVSLDEAVEEAICFGWIDSKLKSLDDKRYIHKYSPRKPGSVWSLVNKLRAEKLIKDGLMTGAGLALIEHAKKNGSWDAAYTNKKIEAMPPDLETALKKNKKAHTNFHAFANTYRNMYIGWINSAKTPETRKNRIKQTVLRSSLNKKPGIE